MKIWKPINSDAEYDKAQARLEELIDIDDCDPRMNELLLLSFLIEEYDHELFPVPDAEPVEVIKYVMELKGIKQKDLIEIFGSKGHVSRVLKGDRNITIDKINPLARLLKISPASLIPRD